MTSTAFSFRRKMFIFFLASLCQPPRSAITINKNVVLSNWALAEVKFMFISLSLPLSLSHTHAQSPTHSHTHIVTHKQCRWSFYNFDMGSCFRVLSRRSVHVYVETEMTSQLQIWFPMKESVDTGEKCWWCYHNINNNNNNKINKNILKRVWR